MTLTEFLLARIEDDEDQARAAGSYHWVRSGINSVEERVPQGYGRAVVFGDGGPPYSSEADHIARHNPARVLAECDAKRRMVDLHGGDYDGECQSPSHLDGPCRSLRALALPYADHPDYREEWKP